MFFTLHNQTAIAQPALSGLSPLDSSKGVRVVKDYLSLGVWKNNTGTDLAATPAMLAQLANDFARMKANGVPSNLYWGSRPDGGPLGQHGVEAKNAIAPVDQVFVEGDRIYFSIYTTAEQAALLANPAHKVSAGIAKNWTDGAKNTYELATIHIAIVDQPVVTGQGPFLMLSNEYQEDEMTPELKASIDTLLATNKTLAEGFITLSNEFKTFKTEQEAKKANAKKDAWKTKLDELFAAKKIDAATLSTYEGLGESAAFNLALLAPLDNVIMLANESGAQGHAKKDDEDLTAATKLETDAQVEARLKARGVDVTLMPKIG